MIVLVLALAGGRRPSYVGAGWALAGRLGWSSRLGCFSRAGPSNELDMARKWAELSQHGFGEHLVPCMYKPCAVGCGMMPPGAGDIGSSGGKYWTPFWNEAVDWICRPCELYLQALCSVCACPT